MSNSVSCFKLIKLKEYYENLIDYKVFNNTMESSMILEPIESSVSSVNIGDEISSEMSTVLKELLFVIFSLYMLLKILKIMKNVTEIMEMNIVVIF